MNASDRLAQCMSVGGDADACAELVESEKVDGVWCDGQIVYDEGGKRCVSREMLDRVRAARGLSPSPLPSPVVFASGTETGSRSAGLWVLGFIASVFVFVIASHHK